MFGAPGHPIGMSLLSSGSVPVEAVPSNAPLPREKEKTFAAFRLEIAALCLITLLGLALRLYALTSHGIWFDEGYHIELVKLPSVASMLDAILSNPPSDPLYALLLRLWVSLFGHGDAVVRSLSAVLGASTLPAIYWLGTSLGIRWAGLLAALLFAISPYAMEFGQEAALYTLAALTTTLALAAGFSFLRTGRGGTLYLLLAVIAIYSHYVVAVILALFAVLPIVVSFEAVPPRRWIALNALVLAAWTPWLVLLILHWVSSDVPRAFIGHRATLSELTDALAQYTAGSVPLQRSRGLLRLVGLVSGAGLTVAALVGRGLNVRLFRALFLGAAALYFFPWLLSALSGRWLFVPHFMLFLLPLLFLILAAGVVRFGGSANIFFQVAMFVLLALWLGAQIAGLVDYYRNPPHGVDGLRELAATLNAHVSGEPLFVTPPAMAATLAQYYPGAIYGLPSDFDLRRVYLPYDPAAWNAECLQRLSSVAAGRSFWLVYRADLDQGGSFLETLQRMYTQTEHQSYPYADLYHFILKH